MNSYLLNFSNGATRIFHGSVPAIIFVDTNMAGIPWSLFPSKSQYPLGSCVLHFSPTSLLSSINHPNDRLGSHRACESSQSRPKGSHRVLEGNSTAETSHLGGTGGFRHRKSGRFPVTGRQPGNCKFMLQNEMQNVQLDV